MNTCENERRRDVTSAASLWSRVDRRASAQYVLIIGQDWLLNAISRCNQFIYVQESGGRTLWRGCGMLWIYDPRIYDTNEKLAARAFSTCLSAASSWVRGESSLMRHCTRVLLSTISSQPRYDRKRVGKMFWCRPLISGLRWNGN